MKRLATIPTIPSPARCRTWFLLIAALSLVIALPGRASPSHLVVWDTGKPLGLTLDLEAKDLWNAVPSDLISLEADPAKAASDPAYYGREYTFRGDAVVENESLTVAFWSAGGRIVIYRKDRIGQPNDGAKDKSKHPRKVAEVAPLVGGTSSGALTRCEVLRNVGDQVALAVTFSAPGSTDLSAIIAFDKSEIVELKPGANLKGFRVTSPIDYGVVPGFVGDDLIYGPSQKPAGKTLSLPAESLFVGLLQGEDAMLVMAWPGRQQQVRLRGASATPNSSTFESADFEGDSQPIYLAAVGAPGIWHREELTSAYLEKEVASQWKRPFSAKWTTQLPEAGVMTSFSFREAKGQIWRGVPGMYNYPVWFDGEKALFHLSKKVPPKGQALIYFLEGDNTPVWVSTPVDILKATLGRAATESILDVAGRKLRSHHRRGSTGVRRACTCGCTEAIQAIFEAGTEVNHKEEIDGALDDMIYFVKQHVERIEEYRRFADEMIAFLRSASKSNPEANSYVSGLELIAQQIPQEYSVQKENMKSLEYAGELSRKTMALTSRKEAKNLEAYLDLLKAWRAMGGAQDYVVAQCHAITRKLFQEAGYGCADRPKLVELAKQIRQRCRQPLRNPDGYEIWPNY